MTQTAIDLITKEFRIPYQNRNYLQEKIAEINKRAKRLSCPPIALETITIETETHEDGEITLFAHMRVSGASPRIHGWTFVASVEHLDDGNLVHVIPGLTPGGDLTSYHQGKQVCEHCHTTRQRNTTYILKSEDGEFKQVGRQCLKDFLGHPSPMSLAARAEMLALAGELAEACEDEGFSGSSRSGRSLSTENYLAWVHASIRQSGWVSRAQAQEQAGYLATADAALDAMNRYQQLPGQYADTRPTEQDREATQQALAWISSEGEERTWNALNDFQYNLHVVCKSPVLSIRHTGIAAALFTSYTRTLEQERKHQQASVVSEWQGEVGKRGTFVLTCQSVHDTEFSYVYTLADYSGNQFVWFSSRSCLTPGETYTLLGTVKDKTVYKDVKQTVLTRCKVKED